MLAIGTQLGPYQVLAPLAAGGMGEVYRAKHSRLEREVAIKVLPEPFARDPDRLARFEREAKAVAALSHPNILAIHDYGTEQGVCYAVMELLQGETLRQRLKDSAVPWRKAVEIGVAIADGVAAAHAKGIVHRDLKPENLFVTTDGRVKILDFGLARFEVQPAATAETGPYTPAATELGAILGTVGYMSPEQVRGQVTDARSDIFSLGCVLYEMVTGQRPFTRATAAETQTAILHDDVPELSASARSIPPEVERVIRHSLEKNREERFQTARDLAFALRALLTDSSMTSVERQRRETRPGLPHKLWLTAALVLLGLAGALLYGFVRNGKQHAGGPPSEATQPLDLLAVLPDQPIDSLAVLPFVSEGGDADAGFLGDGLCITLGNSLLQVRNLKVRPYSSVSQYRGKDTDALAAGRALQVQVVLTGSVQKHGDNLLINVELVDVRDNHKIWGELYPRKFGDLLAVQTEIARDVTAKLRLTLTGEEQQQLAKQPTNNLEAYRLYVLGRVEWNKRTFEGLTKGIDYFQRAINTDRAYALAYSGLADCYTVLNASSHVPAKAACPKALEALTTALKLDNTLAEAHAALGLLKTHYEWDWPGAEKAFRSAIELKPNYATAHHWKSVYLSCMGRFDQALAEAKLAQALDPDSLIIDTRVGTQLLFAGRTDQAIDHFRKVLERDKNYYVTHSELGTAYMVKGMYPEAVREFQEARRLDENLTTLSNLGRGYAAHGEQDKARAVLAQLKELARRRDFTPAIMASIHAALGEDDRALELLERGYEDRWSLMTQLRIEPAWTSLRSQLRFVALVKKMNFPP